MIVLQKVPARRVRIEIAGNGHSVHKAAFLASRQKLPEMKRRIAVTRFPILFIQGHRSQDAPGGLQVAGSAPVPLHYSLPVFPGGRFEGLTIFRESLGSLEKHRYALENLPGYEFGPGKHVIRRANHTIRVIAQRAPADVPAFGEAYFQQPLQAPLHLFGHPGVKCPVPLYRFQHIQQGVAAVSRAPEALREVSGVVPAAVYHLLFLSGKALGIGMTDVMDTFHRIATALTKIEVKRAPERFFPYVGANGERLREHVPIAKTV